MLTSTAILSPVIALIAWSMLMMLWMYATRIPAIKASKMRLDPNAIKGEQMASLPAKVRWKADNYNHLMEQPTLFYALAISLAMLGAGEGWNLMWAWLYVALRVLHSLVQALLNLIELRFVMFLLSNVALAALTVNALCLIYERGLL